MGCIMARMTRKKANQRKFEEMMEDGITPEALIAEVMQGKRKLAGARQKEQYEAAKVLLPYRMPKLNNVDAINRNVDMSHEDFIKSLDDEGDGE